MRSRDVVGRRIVRVNQERTWNVSLQRFDMMLQSLVLDDGTQIVVMPMDDEVEGYVRAWTQRP